MTTTTPIVERVEELHEQMAAHAPEEVLAINVRDRAGLAAAGTPRRCRRGRNRSGGCRSPRRERCEHHALRRDRGKSAAVIFYRGAWCPDCNIALATYQEQLVPELTERGVTMIP